MPGNSPSELNHLLTTNQEWVRRLARRLVRQPADAEEVVQDTWLAAARNHGLGRVLSAGWLNRVVRNLAAQQHRRRGRPPGSDPVAADRGEVPSPSETVEQLEAQRAMIQAVLELSEIHRETILLRYFHDRSARQIADQQGVPAATVRSRLQRGLRELRGRLRQQFGEDGPGWMATVLPLARAETSAILVAPSLAGALIMSTLLKVVLGVAAMAAAGALLLQLMPDAPQAGSSDNGSTLVSSRPVTNEKSGVGPERLEVVSGSSMGVDTSGAEGEIHVATGRAVDDDTGQPVQAAQVWLHRSWDIDGIPPSGSVQTDEDGRFEVSFPRWAPTFLHLRSAEHAYRGVNIGRTTRVNSRESRVDVGDVRLFPGTRISGTVLDSLGRPLGGAEVYLCEMNMMSSFLPAISRLIGRSGPDGSFVAEHVPPSGSGESGFFVISARGFGYRETEILHGQDSISGFDIRLMGNESLDVEVVDDGGRPITDAVVEAFPIQEPFVLSNWSYSTYVNRDSFPGAQAGLGERASLLDIVQAMTGEDGHARFESLPAGFPCTVRAHAGGFVSALRKVVRPGENGVHSIRIEMIPRVLRTVSGRVLTELAQPISGVLVRTYQRYQSTWSDPNFRQEAITDEQGRFEFGQLEPGSRFHLVLFGDGIASRPLEIRVPVDRDLAEQDVVAEESTPIEGRVVDDADSPIPGAQVTLRRGGRTVWGDLERTEEDGGFRFSNATSGKWLLRVSLPEPTERWSSRTVDLPVQGGDEGVLVRAGSVHASLTHVDVRVVDGATGQPRSPKMAIVGQKNAIGPEPSHWQSGRRSMGRAEFFDLAPGDWMILVECDGFPQALREFTIAEGEADKRLRIEMRPPGSLVGEIRPVGSLSEGELQLLRGCQVNALDARGMNLGHAQVEVGPGVGTSLFRFGELPEGVVQLELNGWFRGSAITTVRSGTETRAVLDADRAGTLVIRGEDSYRNGYLELVLTTSEGEQSRHRLVTPRTQPRRQRRWFMPVGPVTVAVRAEPDASEFTSDEEMRIVAEMVLEILAGQETVLDIPPPR